MTGAFAFRTVHRPVLLGVCLAAILATSGAGAGDAVSTLPAKVLLFGGEPNDPAGRAGSSEPHVPLGQGLEPTGSAATNSGAEKILRTPSGAPLAQSTGPANPGTGSRLLRALEGGADGSRPTLPSGPAASASSSPSHSPSARAPGVPIPAAPVSVVDGCRRDVLTRLLAGAAAREDALSALAIEQETLKLCHERQLIVTGIFEAEAQLRSLRAPVEPPAAAISRSPVSVPAVVPQLNAAPTTPVRKPAKTAPKQPRYGWFSIVGMAGDLRAGITDGRRVWFVREGDPLPGAVRVGRIAARPPGVRLKGGDDGALPYRARPGDGQ